MRLKLSNRLSSGLFGSLTFAILTLGPLPAQAPCKKRRGFPRSWIGERLTEKALLRHDSPTKWTVAYFISCLEDRSLLKQRFSFATPQRLRANAAPSAT